MNDYIKIFCVNNAKTIEIEKGSSILEIFNKSGVILNSRVVVMLTVSTCIGWSEDISAAGPKEPMKFYVPHMPVSFGPGGQLVCVSPSSPSDGQTALVELHSMEVNKILCPLNVSMLLPASLA